MLILTRPAIAAIQSAMTVNDKLGQGIRIMAESGGCSGPQYAMRFEAEPAPTDTIVEIRDVRLFLDQESMTILGGATVDYCEDPDNFGFNFTLAESTEEAPASSCASKPSGNCSCARPS
jgi:iron-sulfur cluster assembly protein